MISSYTAHQRSIPQRGRAHTSHPRTSPASPASMKPLFNLFSSLKSYRNRNNNSRLVVHDLAVNTYLCRKQGRKRPFEDHPLHALSSSPSQVSSLHKHGKLEQIACAFCAPMVMLSHYACACHLFSILAPFSQPSASYNKGMR